MKPKKIFIWQRINSAVFLSAFAACILCPPQAAADSREIRIVAAVSSSFKQNPDWQKEIRDRILFVNQIFEKSFGIHFSVKQFLNWEPQDEKRETSLLIEELRSQFELGTDEVVVGFHKMSQAFSKDAMEDLDTIGTAQFFKGYVVLRDPFQDIGALRRQAVMAHEFGHLFGAIHVAGEGAMMNAALSLDPVLELDSDNREIIKISSNVDFQVGIESLTAADIDRLIQIYEKLIRRNPHSDFYYELGYFYKVRGLTARAVSVWEEAVKQEYSNPMIHWALGQHYYESSRFDAAIQELGAAVAFFILPSQQKQRAQAFNFLGVAYYRKGNSEQALVQWLKGLSSDPDSLELQGNLAAAYLQKGDLDRGIAELLKLSVKYPDDETTQSNLGIAYLQKKDYGQSAQVIQKALQLNKVKAQESFSKKGRQEGVSDASRLMTDIPEAGLRANLGAAYLGLGNDVLAAEEFRKAKTLNPDNLEASHSLAHLYLKEKNYKKAIEECQQALKLKSDAPYPYAFLAEAYAMLGKRALAVQAAREGLRYAAEAPLKASLYKNIGILYAQEQKFAEAQAELKNSLNYNWNDADTHVKLGYMYGETGRLEEAKRSFQTALRVNPSDAEAKKAMESMPPGK